LRRYLLGSRIILIDHGSPIHPPGVFAIVACMAILRTTDRNRLILLKNSLSVQTRFLSFMVMQPKFRGNHDVQLTEKD
jgi:hypothetical protein